MTGTSRGIGRAIALTLAAHGAQVALAARTVADLARVAEIAAAGGKALAVPTQDERGQAWCLGT